MFWCVDKDTRVIVICGLPSDAFGPFRHIFLVAKRVVDDRKSVSRRNRHWSDATKRGSCCGTLTPFSAARFGESGFAVNDRRIVIAVSCNPSFR